MYEPVAEQPSALTLRARQARIKRAFDVCLAVSALAVLAPLILTLSGLLLAVQGRRLLDPDRRIGQNGVSFSRLRFRTRDADGVTPLGFILLRTNIDEIPQLWNVLRGDMSFVGPPPALAPEEAVTIKPGLTCPWQAGDFAGREQLGKYVRGWTLRADVAVLLRALVPHGNPRALT